MYDFFLESIITFKYAFSMSFSDFVSARKSVGFVFPRILGCKIDLTCDFFLYYNILTLN